MEQNQTMTYDNDVIIIGGGPAGTTTAKYIQPSKHNIKTLIIDRKQKIGTPVQCGEALFNAAEGQQLKPELEDDETGLFACPPHIIAHPLHKLQILSPKKKTFEFNIQGSTFHRDLFDQYLLKKALAAGARVQTKTTFIKFIDKHTILTNQGLMTSRIFVGADGPKSLVAKNYGLQTPTKICRCAIVKVKGDFHNHTMKIFFGKRYHKGYAWIFPKGDHANVGFGTEGRIHQPIHKILNQFIHDELNCDITQTYARGGGIIPSGGPIKQTVKQNVLIVGDAAGMVFPNNGSGIGPAMVAGRECGTAIANHLIHNEPLKNYEIRWRALMGIFFKRALYFKTLFQWITTTDYLLELCFKLANKNVFVNILFR